MLREIVFLITDKKQLSLAEQMKNNSGKDGDMIIIREISDYGTEYNGTESCETENDAMGNNDIESCDILRHRGNIYNKEDILFVADAERILKKLKEKGNYVMALLHEGNKEQDLSGAPYAVSDIEELMPDSLKLAYMRLAGEPWTILQTERCIIREMTVEDVDTFYEIYKEPSITYYMDELFKEPESEREYTRQYIKQIYGFYGYGLWSIVNKESGKVIGRAGISWREGFDIPELGFVIAVPCQHQGYAYEACKAILIYGKEELHFTKIQALLREGNEASARLCMRLGFKKEDRLEDKGEFYERYIADL